MLDKSNSNNNQQKICLSDIFWLKSSSWIIMGDFFKKTRENKKNAPIQQSGGFYFKLTIENDPIF